ncbi:hypothetical protein MYX76_04990 [Desulfobacterota bacterium AH_259_B03_O07]|nr:hypothetical protein [Desulfobacterota bacterium AH_259_B03_O07]
MNKCVGDIQRFVLSPPLISEFPVACYRVSSRLSFTPFSINSAKQSDTKCHSESSEESNRVCFVALLLAIVDLRYFRDGLFDFNWAFKKLPKSIPEALKKDLGLG